MKRNIILSVGAGLSLALTGLFSEAWPLLFFSFIPLFYLNGNTKTKIAFAYVSVLIWNLFSNLWLLGTNDLGYYLVSILNAVIYTLTFALYFYFRRWSKTLALCLWLLVFVMVELYHLTADFSFPYLILGHSLAKFPKIVQWYSYTSVLGGSFWVLLFNAIVAYFIKFNYKYFFTINKLAILLCVLMLPVVCSCFIYYLKSIKKPKNTFDVLVFHPSLDVYKRERESLGAVSVANRFINQYLDSLKKQPKLHIWPENSLITAGDIHKLEVGVSSEIGSLIKTYGFDLLSGAVLTERVASLKEKNKRKLDWVQNERGLVIYNSNLLISPNQPPQFTSKQKLAPIEENRFPYQPILFYLSNHIGRLGGFNFSVHSDNKRILTTSCGIRIGSLICFESFFPWVVKEVEQQKPDFLVVLLNEDWYRSPQGAEKTLLASQARVLETGLYCVRASNGGFSSIINHLGEIEKIERSNKPKHFTHKIKVF